MTELKGAGRLAGPLYSQTAITDGGWHRVGFVWDGVKRMLYADGVLVASDTQSRLAGSDGTLIIGRAGNMAPGTSWTGLIDDVRIYDRAVRP
jgi:hypothetical protein